MFIRNSRAKRIGKLIVLLVWITLTVFTFRLWYSIPDNEKVHKIIVNDDNSITIIAKDSSIMDTSKKTTITEAVKRAIK